MSLLFVMLFVCYCYYYDKFATTSQSLLPVDLLSASINLSICLIDRFHQFQYLSMS